MNKRGGRGGREGGRVNLSSVFNKIQIKLNKALPHADAHWKDSTSTSLSTNLRTSTKNGTHSPVQDMQRAPLKLPSMGGGAQLRAPNQTHHSEVPILFQKIKIRKTEGRDRKGYIQVLLECSFNDLARESILIWHNLGSSMNYKKEGKAKKSKKKKKKEKEE